jgi:uncharacterized repeat protein (TIGR01451 family)
VDVDPTNNTASATVNVRQVADVAVALAVQPDPVQVGAELTFTATVINGGPNITDATLIDPLPAGLAFDSTTASQGAVTMTSGAVQAQLGLLAPGASSTVRIVVRPVAVGTAINRIRVMGPGIDPDTAAGQASVRSSPGR